MSAYYFLVGVINTKYRSLSYLQTSSLDSNRHGQITFLPPKGLNETPFIVFTNGASYCINKKTNIDTSGFPPKDQSQHLVQLYTNNDIAVRTNHEFDTDVSVRNGVIRQHYIGLQDRSMDRGRNFSEQSQPEDFDLDEEMGNKSCQVFCFCNAFYRRFIQ